MSRIVIEASKQEKEALSLKLEELGKTFKEWFEESLDTTLDHSQPFDEQYVLPEAQLSTDILDVAKIKSDIEKADLSFTGSDTSYLTHDIHPYPAKYIPQLPANFIRRLSLIGDTVLDPFGGSGTTATESARLKRKAISLDANPLAALLGEVKTITLTHGEKNELGLLYETAKSYLNDISSLPTYGDLEAYIPKIPNHEKWFADTTTKELALIRKLIEEITTSNASKVAYTALSRIIVRVSFQDSETRYVSKPRDVKEKVTLKAFLDSLNIVLRKLIQFEKNVENPQTTVFLGDSRESLATKVGEESVGLIVTSPPYANATDYHLYHRFRIFWLGFNPKSLADVEIGSHLKHQKKKTGFEEYLSDMTTILEHSFKALISGRFAVFVVGDSIFKEKVYNTADELQKVAEAIGFEHITTVERSLPENRRSFAKPARRARGERVLVLRKPQKILDVTLNPPNYKLWPYERELLSQEVSSLLNLSLEDINSVGTGINVKVKSDDINQLSRLTFCPSYSIDGKTTLHTFQSQLEIQQSKGKKKESKYVTHGIHTYKGKFYPQLAKVLINISKKQPGAVVLDPFCGSGTVLLESHLNGFKSIGSDMNPLAVKISKAKTEILSMKFSEVSEAIQSLISYFESYTEQYTQNTDEFADGTLDDVFSWFPLPVVYKLNFILHQIRLFGDKRLVNFLEVILSESIREVSHQDPKDLRIRRRSEPLEDAPVVEMFCSHLTNIFNKIKLLKSSEYDSKELLIESEVYTADNRSKSYLSEIGIEENSIDLVLTSPPYATALPYIDTDRLSLLAILGIPTKNTRVLERQITGSREIQTKAREEFNKIIKTEATVEHIPSKLLDELRHILTENIAANAGFRKLNTPAVLLRYFIGMSENLSNVYKALKEDGMAFYIIGDSKTKVNDEWFPIKTTYWISEIAKSIGFTSELLIDISVTTENLINQKNAITENGILKLVK